MSPVSRWLPLALLLAATPVLAAPRVAPPPAKETVYWKGAVGGYAIHWSNRDLLITKLGGAPLYSARRDSLKYHQDMEATCEADDATQVLSVVGPIVSREDSYAGNCPGTAHPFASRTYSTFDLRTGKEADLRDWFPEDAIRKALLGDRLVQKALDVDHPGLPTLTTLLVALDGTQSPDCLYFFEKDMVKHFAFHHVKGNQVAVRIGLTHGCEAARGNLTQLGIYLPIPKALAGPLARAAAGREGFLMERAPKGQTVVSYGPEHRTWLP
jgi:hypothetical protein